MIQRIQSLYIFLAAICLLLIGYFINDSVTFFNSTHLLAYSGGLILVVALFLFKKLKIQFQLLNFTFGFILCLIADFSISYFNTQNAQILIFILGGCLAMAMNFLARTSIKKDIDLLQSIDRIR